MTSKSGITKDGKHSFLDFGLTVVSRTYTPAQKKKITAEMPYMCGSYDFSTIGGLAQAYTDEQYTYIFVFAEDDAGLRDKKLRNALNWLNSGKSILQDDTMPERRINAECISTSANEKGILTEITAVFNADYKSLCGIKIKSLPDKLCYVLSDKIDVAGLTVVEIYTDGSEKQIYEFSFRLQIFSSYGKKRLTVVHPDYPDLTDIGYLYCCSPLSDFEFMVYGDHAVAEKYTGADENVCVPPVYEGLPVTKIGTHCFMGNTAVKSVMLIDTISISED